MKQKYLFVGLFFLLSAFVFWRGKWLSYPDYFPVPKYNFVNNPLDSNVIFLGRNLFYEPMLSANNSISCASCHSPYNAFSHTDHSLSHGIFDSIGKRNAPALFNLAWQEKFMWDGAVNHLDVQALAPISNPLEMGETIKNCIAKLNHSNKYKQLFYKAFNDSLITGERTLKALSQFELTLVSAAAKYDKVKQGKALFNYQEQHGYEIFKKNCNTCHAEPLFSTYQFKNNGLSIEPKLMDYGRMEITHNPKDRFLFKVPSLRNLSFTYPYMHDGRYKHLSQVINHYTDSLLFTKNLSQELQQGVMLNSNEKVDLIAFLLTLNDTLFVFNKQNHYPRQKTNK
jgi:cytochrome c peroxidase